MIRRLTDGSPRERGAGRARRAAASPSTGSNWSCGLGTSLYLSVVVRNAMVPARAVLRIHGQYDRPRYQLMLAPVEHGHTDEMWQTEAVRVAASAQRPRRAASRSSASAVSAAAAGRTVQATVRRTPVPPTCRSSPHRSVSTSSARSPARYGSGGGRPQIVRAEGPDGVEAGPRTEMRPRRARRPRPLREGAVVERPIDWQACPRWVIRPGNEPGRDPGVAATNLQSVWGSFCRRVSWNRRMLPIRILDVGHSTRQSNRRIQCPRSSPRTG